MRKRLIDPTQENTGTCSEGLLDIEREAVLEFTSEDPDYPIESAFAPGNTRGWRAAAAGTQTIRLDRPQNLDCIALVFEENETARTQEFVRRCSSDEQKITEILRQEWNFSPPSSTCEIEEYRIRLSAVAMLELVINPDISGGDAHASLKNFRAS